MSPYQLSSDFCFACHQPPPFPHASKHLQQAMMRLECQRDTDLRALQEFEVQIMWDDMSKNLELFLVPCDAVSTVIQKEGWLTHRVGHYLWHKESKHGLSMETYFFSLQLLPSAYFEEKVPAVTGGSGRTWEQYRGCPRGGRGRKMPPPRKSGYVHCKVLPHLRRSAVTRLLPTSFMFFFPS